MVWFFLIPFAPFSSEKLRYSTCLPYRPKLSADVLIPLHSVHSAPGIEIKPYTDNTVKISKYYYSSKDEETKQQQSLIKYENIYMPNTGILYSSDKEFNIVSTLNGKVITVKEDEILGNIVEIEHENNIVTIYQSIKDINVKVGDTIKQGDLIAKSGPNKLENEKENCLHFEVYQEGNLINPETLYNLELSK